MDTFSNIEVKLRCVKGIYNATTTSFPKCKGLGDTAEIALEKLSHSISRFLARVAKEAIGNVFSSNRYTEVVLDVSQGDHEQVRVFDLDASVSAISKSLFVKVKPITTMGSRQKDIQDLSSLLSSSQSLDTKRYMSSVQSGELSSYRDVAQKSDEDGIVFGFYLSYN